MRSAAWLVGAVLPAVATTREVGRRPVGLLQPSTRADIAVRPRVWDGVIDEEVRVALRDELDHEGYEGTYILDRLGRGPRTVAESVICSLLEELGDDAPFVEYWSRGEHVPIGLHRDIDEALAEICSDPDEPRWSLQRCPIQACRSARSTVTTCAQWGTSG